MGAAIEVSETPLVSAIMIFFNAKQEDFFEEAITSVLSQTYTNWELLLVDDGSTDESRAIAKTYAEQYSQKIRYLEHENHQNRGMSAARNLGIRHAKGEYVAFLDADDVWLPHKLKEQLSILESHPEAAMVYGRTLFWFGWTGKPADLKRDYLTKTSVLFDTLIEPSTQLILYLLDGGHTFPCTCSGFIRRQVFEDIGAFEETFRNANEDMVFHTKVFLNAPVFVSSQCWDRYRRHPNSYWESAPTTIRPDNHKVERLKYLSWLKQYLIEQNIQDPKVWAALKKAFFPYEHPILHTFTFWNIAKWTGKKILPLSVRKWLKNTVRRHDLVL